jgi:hypothetical protein
LGQVKIDLKCATNRSGFDLGMRGLMCAIAIPGAALMSESRFLQPRQQAPGDLFFQLIEQAG